MKKHFLTGLAILLPLALTIVIVTFLVNLLTAPFIGVVKPLLSSINIFKTGFFFLSGSQLLVWTSRIVILVLLFAVTVLLGALTRWVIVNYFIHIGDAILHRIPFINTVYKTTQEVIKTIFSSSKQSFKQVALVPFPHEETLSIGLVTRRNVPTEKGDHFVACFVPTTPNPTSGFLMLFDPKDVQYLDMSIEEAFKFIISCGVIPSTFSPSEPLDLPVDEDNNDIKE